MTDNVWIWIAGQFVVAAAIWGGIRADIKAIHRRIDSVERSSSDAHLRIDRHLERFKPE